MLKNLDPLLNADVLYALRSMGHGDTLAVVDTNFPADSVARQTILGELLSIDNVSATRAISAILSVFPLDTPIQPSVGRMEVMGEPETITDVQGEVQKEIDARSEEHTSELQSLMRISYAVFCLKKKKKKTQEKHHIHNT